MQTAQTKAPKPEKEFLSPLDHFIEVNCQKCGKWQKSCNLGDPKASDRIMLCMTAQSLGYGMNLECVRP
jgi:hypothetical protein